MMKNNFHTEQNENLLPKKIWIFNFPLDAAFLSRTFSLVGFWEIIEAVSKMFNENPPCLLS